MPDQPKIRNLIRRMFQLASHKIELATHKLEDPRPSWASKPVTTPRPDRGSQPAPGGGAGPVTPRPTPEPAAVADGPPPAARTATAFNQAARTPAETARLERGAELRRGMDADRETRAREDLAKAHQQKAERVRRQLDREQATPDDREAAAADLDQQHAAASRSLDVHFEAVRAETTATIAEAEQLGYFADPLETMLSGAFERANGLGAGRGDDSSGRGLGD